MVFLSLTTWLRNFVFALCRHHKRRIVQPGLVDAIAQRLSRTGFVYLSSDVHEVAVDMRQRFEERASDKLEVASLHDRLPTFDRAEEQSCAPMPAAATQRQAPPGEAAAADPAAASEWARKQWLAVNPIGLPTEREVWVLSQGLPMFRLLLCRKQTAQA